jgi:hypothetical protein
MVFVKSPQISRFFFVLYLVDIKTNRHVYEEKPTLNPRVNQYKKQ